MKTDDGVLEPLWSSNPVLPESLVDLLGTVESEDDDADEDEFDLDDFDFDSGDESDDE